MSPTINQPNNPMMKLPLANRGTRRIRQESFPGSFLRNRRTIRALARCVSYEASPPRRARRVRDRGRAPARSERADLRQPRATADADRHRQGQRHAGARSRDGFVPHRDDRRSSCDSDLANAAIANALTAGSRRWASRLARSRRPATRLSYNPRPPKPDPASQQRYGYTVERTSTSRVDDVDAAGAVVDAGVAAGVTGRQRDHVLAARPAAPPYRERPGGGARRRGRPGRGLAAAAKVRLVRILAIAPAGRRPRPLPRAGPRHVAPARADDRSTRAT